MSKIVLVRHGQTDWNLNRRIQGSTDIPLNDTGRAEALDAAAALQDQSWDAIVSSPLSRAQQTAAIIAQELGLDAPLLLDTIVERRYGDAEGLTGEQVLERYSDRAVIPGQETRSEVSARVSTALIGLAAEYPDKALIVVTHGGVIGSMLRHVTGGALPFPGEVIANGSVHEFMYRDGQLVVNRALEGHGQEDVVQAAVR